MVKEEEDDLFSALSRNHLDLLQRLVPVHQFPFKGTVRAQNHLHSLLQLMSQKTNENLPERLRPAPDLNNRCKFGSFCFSFGSPILRFAFCLRAETSDLHPEPEPLTWFQGLGKPLLQLTFHIKA